MVNDLKSSPLSSIVEPLEEDQREMIAESQRQDRLPLLAQFLRITEIDAIRKIGEACEIEVLEDFELLGSALQVVPLRMIHEYQCLPFKDEEEDFIHLITLWPPEENMDDWVYAVCGKHPRWHLGPAKAITHCITQNFGVGSESLSDTMIADADSSGREIEDSEDENAALIRFVNEVIHKAISDRATDIHFEPLKESLQIRYRIDGELVPIRLPDNLMQFQGAIISRLKIMAKLNISEKRRPQDGRIDYRSGTDELDIRISTMPTMYGESVSLRLLNQKSQILGFKDVGLLPRDQEKIKRVLDLPHGIILVTGPTGSGKSTSLTAFIRHINTPGKRIITVEDPVEYEVPGVNQTQVRHEIGYDFAAALRHILRQDPDVIMVGEIRDPETADIAIRAALTGHLVFSTIHTNDAPGALTRLIDMEIEPFLIASSVELIIAQRLVRRLCQICRKPADFDASYLQECVKALQLQPAADDLTAQLYQPVGCESCRNLGFRGRIGIFEILRINDEIHEMIIQKATARQIRQVAVREGMVSLQQSGWDQVKLGATALGEVMHFAKIGEEG